MSYYIVAVYKVYASERVKNQHENAHHLGGLIRIKISKKLCYYSTHENGLMRIRESSMQYRTIVWRWQNKIMHVIMWYHWYENEKKIRHYRYPQADNIIIYKPCLTRAILSCDSVPDERKTNSTLLLW